jgi:hypothetical protein
MNAGAQTIARRNAHGQCATKESEVVPTAAPVEERKEGSRQSECASDQGPCDPVIADETPPSEFGNGFANRKSSDQPNALKNKK